jgi:hypothetical protein
MSAPKKCSATLPKTIGPINHMVDYLNKFVEFYDLNVHYQTCVTLVQKQEEDGSFALSTVSDNDDNSVLPVG